MTISGYLKMKCEKYNWLYFLTLHFKKRSSFIRTSENNGISLALVILFICVFYPFFLVSFIRRLFQNTAFVLGIQLGGRSFDQYVQGPKSDLHHHKEMKSVFDFCFVLSFETGSHNIAQAGLDRILLAQPLEWWNYRFLPPSLTCTF